MGRVRISRHFPGRISQAEAVWYDLNRWPSWVDGLARISRVEGDWPQAGSKVTWDSPPGGRGRVLEQVITHEARVGQTVQVEDEKMTGEQRLSFSPHDDGVDVALELRYRVKESNLFTPVVDFFFIRPRFIESLTRTVNRFGAELRMDRELAETGEP
jgi:hypothetical protein